MNIKAVIFDQDGVLIDSELIHFKALCNFFNNHNLSYELSTHEKYFGFNAHNFFTQMRETHGIPLEVDYMKTKSREYIKEIEGEIQLMPEVHTTLTELNKVVPHLGLATGTYRELTERNLNRLNLKSFFKETLCGDEVQNGKPHPEIYLKTADKLQILPSECVVIEDSPAGIQSAKNAGMSVISYRAQHNAKADLSKADYQIKNLREITPFIIALNQTKKLKNHFKSAR